MQETYCGDTQPDRKKILFLPAAHFLKTIFMTAHIGTLASPARQPTSKTCQRANFYYALKKSTLEGLVFINIVIIPLICLGQDNYNVKTEIETNAIYRNEAFVVSFKINAFADTFLAPDFSEFYLLNGPSTSKKTDWIKNNAMSSTAFNYILIPRSIGKSKIKKGVFKIKEKEIKTPKAKIKVLDKKLSEIDSVKIIGKLKDGLNPQPTAFLKESGAYNFENGKTEQAKYFFNRAQEDIKNKLYYHAIENLEKSIEIMPDNPLFIYQRADMSRYLHQNGIAVEKFTQLIDKCELNIEMTNELKSAKFSENPKYKIIEYKTNNRSSYEYLSKAYFGRGHVRYRQYFDKSTEDFNKAFIYGIKANFDSLYLSFVECWNEISKNNLSVALELATKAISLKPEFIGSYLARAEIHTRNLDFATAVEDLNIAILKDTLMSDPYYYLGCLKAMIGMEKEAIRYFTITLEKNPWYKEALFDRSQEFAKCEQYDSAIVGYDLIIKQFSYDTILITKVNKQIQLAELAKMRESNAEKNIVDSERNEESPWDSDAFVINAAKLILNKKFSNPNEKYVFGLDRFKYYQTLFSQHEKYKSVPIAFILTDGLNEIVRIENINANEIETDRVIINKGNYKFNFIKQGNIIASGEVKVIQ